MNKFFNSFRYIPQNWCSKNLNLGCSLLMQYSTNVSRFVQSKESFKERLQRIRRAQRKKTSCYLRVRRSEYKCLAYQEIKPDPCIPEPCPLPLDAKAYEPSDKENRNYQKTWCEFKPSPQIMPKVHKIYPVRERRDPKVFRGQLCTACEPEDCELPKSDRAPPPRLFPPRTMPWPCCKLRSPKCRTSRADVRCPRGRMPLCCVKRKTQYLSFSECKKFPLQPPVTACECEMKPSLCEVWNFWRTKR
ncbi:uncharacterized protein LOC117568324 [Drosophila albomicans]|uniref:Uncharacterized protein LOC117568324 n=2 Tax=nasuta subgroup TaxID=32307 RepID=A0A6P8WM91_DROAB|nr:uncharacterized protein LOC117568324 [Drosophila albomicans]